MTHFFTKRFITALALQAFIFILLAQVFQPVEAARLNDIRIWQAPERTRVVLDLDAVPKFKQFYLGNPARFVVDLPGFSLNTQAPDAAKMGPLFKNIRLGVPKKGTARVVLDLAQDVDIKVSLLAPTQGYRNRLVLDVYPKKVVANNKAKKSVGAKTAKVSKPSTVIARQGAKAQPANKPFIIAIDAGHGGEDSGARGRRSYEKTVVLQIAKRLKKKIDAQKGMKAVLTRKGDYFIPLRSRIKIARKAGADLFVSIHADGFKNRKARGSSVYALSLRGASSEEARVLADQENAADLAGGVNLSNRDEGVAKVLLGLAMNSTQHESISFAAAVLKELKKVGKVHNNSVEKAGFVVLKSPDIPSILVETAFITNPQEEKLLRNARHQEKLANAVLVGVKNYLKQSNYHTAIAQ